jgi:5-methylcytosine-specific restriction endonuclease McrBC regulatory subunit McrC
MCTLPRLCFIGSIRCPSGQRLQIDPRFFSVKEAVFMHVASLQMFDTKVAEELLGADNPNRSFTAALAELFSDELTNVVARCGLQHEYAQRRRTCGSVRGTIDFSAQLRKRPGSWNKLECVYEELSTDTRYNRLLLDAVDCLLLADHSQRAQEQLRRVGDQLRRRGVSCRRVRGESPFQMDRSVDEIDRSLVRRDYPKKLEPYALALRLGVWILRGLEWGASDSPTLGVSFLVNVNHVFEEYLRHIFAKQLGLTRIKPGNAEFARPEPPTKLLKRHTLKPDLFYEGAGWILLGDAKNKSLEKKRKTSRSLCWNRDDVFQTITYQTTWQSKRASLVYAHGPEDLELKATDGGHGRATYQLDNSTIDFYWLLDQGRRNLDDFKQQLSAIASAAIAAHQASPNPGRKRPAPSYADASDSDSDSDSDVSI